LLGEHTIIVRIEPTSVSKVVEGRVPGDLEHILLTSFQRCCGLLVKFTVTIVTQACGIAIELTLANFIDRKAVNSVILVSCSDRWIAAFGYIQVVQAVFHVAANIVAYH